MDLGIPGLEDATEVGRGGYGVVYRAREPSLNRTVAIKMLSARLDEAGRERFDREGFAMGTLSGHPNIVSVFGTGATASGRPYISMAYLGEGSLADRVALDGPLPWAEAVRITIKLAGALETAHRAGTLHRDVKPENVLLSDYGEPQLADFGIARVEGRYETGTGHVAASVAHASPEVLDGAAATVASDVYSLGSTLYTLLAGQPAFGRKADEPLVSQYLRIARDPVPDLRPRGVPDAVCRVVEQSLSKEPQRRQASAAELGRQLQEAQRRAGLPVTEMALALPAPDGPRVRSGPLPSGSGEIEPGTEGTVLPGAAPASEGSGARPARPARPARLVVLAPVAAVAVGVLVVAVLVAALLGDGTDEAGRAPSEGDGTRGPTSEATGPPVPDLPSVAVGTDPTSVAVNPRTNRLYVANSGSLTVSVVDAASRDVVATIPMPTRPQAVAVNQRSGRIYVTTAEASIIVIDGESLEVAGTVAMPSRPGGLAVDHRTDRIFVALSDAALAVVDGRSSGIVTTVPLQARPWSVAVIPETNRVFVTSQEGGTLSIIDGSSYEVVASLPVGERPCGVATNPRSRRVYVTGQESGVVTVIDADAGTVVATVDVDARPCGVAVNSQTSRVYVTHEEAGRVSIIDGASDQHLRTTAVFRPSRTADPLPYDVDVNPQSDGVFVVDRGGNRLITLTGDQL